MTRRPRHTAARAEQEARAAEVTARRAAASHVRNWWARRQMLPGFYDSTSRNTRDEFEALIADLENA